MREAFGHQLPQSKGGARVMAANQRPLRPCAVPGCLALTRERCCEAHAARAQDEKSAYDKHYDECRRDRRLAEFYTSIAWRRAREAVRMRDHNLCQDCLQRGRVVFADTVHHIVPVRDAWDRRLQLDNLVSLCTSCHAARHNKTPAQPAYQHNPS